MVTMPDSGESEHRQANSGPTQNITEDEAALYDRQIRLWGVEAQNKLRNASVCLVGLSGLGVEVAKNISLAGLKSLTLVDDALVAESDLSSNFFLTKENIGQNRAEASLKQCQMLNPNVEMRALAINLQNLDEFSVGSYDLVCVFNKSGAVNGQMNTMCRQSGALFCCGTVDGWFGYAFNDFGSCFEFMEEQQQQSSSGNKEQKQPTAGSGDDVLVLDADSDDDEGPSRAKKARQDDEQTTVQQRLKFLDYATVFTDSWPIKGVTPRAKKLVPPAFYLLSAINGCAAREDKAAVLESWQRTLKRCNTNEEGIKLQLQQLLPFTTAQLNPVCAIVGGVLSQDVIKAVSRFGRPLVNTFVYDGLQSTGVVADLPPRQQH